MRVIISATLYILHHTVICQYNHQYIGLVLYWEFREIQMADLLFYNVLTDMRFVALF